MGVIAEGDDVAQNITVTWSEPGSFILYDVACDGGSWQSEVTWELEYLDEIVLTGNAPFSASEVPLFYGDYTLYMNDTWGDGWNGNIWSLTDQNGNLAASCTLDTGTEGVCEFTLGGLHSNNEVLPVTAIDRAAHNKEELVNTSNIVHNNNEFITTEILSRDMLSYKVYRDGQFLVETDLNTFSYVDTDTEHDVVYCYTVKTLYDDGESVDSNVSCDEWILMPAMDLDVTGTNGQVELIWTAANSNDVLGYNINRDGALLDFTTDSFYNDTSAIHNVEYCYTVEAVYDIGNSDPTDVECGMWEILSPDEVFALGEDGVVHVTWTDPPAGGGGGIGDECEYVDPYTYAEGLGYLDCIGQCIPEATVNAWLGDGLCDDGSWGVYFNCDEWNWDNGDCPEYANGDNNGNYVYRSEHQLGNIPPFVPAQDRDLIAFNVYRDGDFLATVEAGTYEYYDYDVVNLTEYCYTVTSVYEVGESEILDDPVCATPIPGDAPSNLFAYGESGAITLEWVQGSNEVIDYNIYRDGQLFDNSTTNMYVDNSAEHDVEYCYIVSANYPSGESLSTNESCAMWILAPPLSISALPGNGFIQVDWTEPGVVTCADEVIPSLPFNTIGSNVGLSNDWTVQGSEGADYAYFLNVTNPTIIDITLCSENTLYDTKLEVFTADPDAPR